MKKTTIILAVVSAASLFGTLSISLWPKQEARQEQVSRLELSEKKANVRDALGGSEAPQEVVRAVPAASAGPAEPQRPRVVADSKRPAHNEVDPSKSRRESLRTLLESSNPDLANELELTQEEAATVLELAVDGMLKELDANSAYTNSVAEGRRASLEAKIAHESAMKALLGEQKFKEWEVYRQGAPQREEVARLRRMLAGGGFPLRDEQARALVEIVSAENVRLVGSQNNTGARPEIASGSVSIRTTDINELEQSQRRLLDAASVILDVYQFDTYQKILGANLTLRREMQSNQQTPNSR